MATTKTKTKLKPTTRTRGEALELVSDYAEKLADASINFSLRHQRGFRFQFTVSGDCDLAKHLFPEFDVQPTSDLTSRYATLDIRYTNYERHQTNS